MIDQISSITNLPTQSGGWTDTYIADVQAYGMPVPGKALKTNVGHVLHSAI